MAEEDTFKDILEVAVKQALAAVLPVLIKELEAALSGKPTDAQFEAWLKTHQEVNDAN